VKGYVWAQNDEQYQWTVSIISDPWWHKAGVKVDSPTGGILGEKPMWMEDGERTTVENTKRLYPGLYASGMAANNVQGGFRMGPIFGGMLKSGRKIAEIVRKDLGQ